MLQGNQRKLIKYSLTDASQLSFLKKHLRSFYTMEIGAWQYPNNAQHSGLFFVKEEEEYIASQGMIPFNLTQHGKQIKTAKSETSFLLPEFRGKGIFEELYFHTVRTAEKDGVVFIWGFTALAKVWREKLKFNVYDNIIKESELQISFFKSIYFVFSTEDSFLNKIKSLLRHIISPHLNFKGIKSDKKYVAKELDLKNTLELESVISTYNLWCKNYPDFISIAFNESFLKWRILENPTVKYNIIGIYKNDSLEGYGIINKMNKRAYLVDFIVADNKHLSNCFHSLLVCLKKQPISHLHYWASSENLYTKSIHLLFASLGGHSTIKEGMNFVLKQTSNSIALNIKLEDFCINSLWTEGFQV